MTPTDLSRRAVAAPRWRWRPGVVTTTGLVVAAVGPDGGLFLAADGWDPPAGHLPDLDDPGTRGHLLALVREAWGEPLIGCAYAARVSAWAVWAPLGDDVGLGDTEAAALVAALEAAPAGADRPALDLHAPSAPGDGRLDPPTGPAVWMPPHGAPVPLAFRLFASHTDPYAAPRIVGSFTAETWPMLGYTLLVYRGEEHVGIRSWGAGYHGVRVEADGPRWAAAAWTDEPMPPGPLEPRGGTR